MFIHSALLDRIDPPLKGPKASPKKLGSVRPNSEAAFIIGIWIWSEVRNNPGEESGLTA